MTQEEQELREQALLELRKQIKAFGWTESANFIASGIEFVADLCATRKVPLFEIRNFRQGARIALKVLGELQDGPSEKEVRRLREAIDLYNRSLELGRNHYLPETESEPWTLSQAMEWREHVDYVGQVCEGCCESWRTIHLDRLSWQHRDPALRCIEEIEKRIPLLRSGRLADVPQQRQAIDKCAILSGQLAGYAGEIPTLRLYTEAIVHDPKKWAALLEALITSKWLDSNTPRGYLTKVVTTIYNLDIRPDVSGQDSQGFHHAAGPGGRGKDSDALRGRRTLALEEIAERPDEALLERRFTERSVLELQKAAEADPRLAVYTRAVTRNPKWKRHDIWASLGWSEKVGHAVDRQYRRLLGRLKGIGAGVEWRVAPTPGVSEASQTTYFETLLDGKNGARFGVIQHKLLKTQCK